MGSSHKGQDRVPNLSDMQGGHPACRGTLPLIIIKAVARSLGAAQEPKITHVLSHSSPMLQM